MWPRGRSSGRGRHRRAGPRCGCAAGRRGRPPSPRRRRGRSSTARGPCAGAGARRVRRAGCGSAPGACPRDHARGSFVPVTQISPGGQYPGLPTHLAALGLVAQRGRIWRRLVAGTDWIWVLLTASLPPSHSELNSILAQVGGPPGAPPPGAAVSRPAAPCFPCRGTDIAGGIWNESTWTHRGLRPGGRPGPVPNHDGDGRSLGSMRRIRSCAVAMTQCRAGRPPDDLDHPAPCRNCVEALRLPLGPFESTCTTPAQRGLECPRRLAEFAVVRRAPALGRHTERDAAAAWSAVEAT